MSDSEHPEAPGLGSRWKLGILLIAVLFVLMPFLFWRSSWFGLPLTDAQIQESFADTEHPRKAQHALAQISERMLRGDATVRRWYPQVLGAANHPSDEIRLTAAWVMGQDNSNQEFHSALAGLLQDPNPMVRHNAALSLVRFGDPSGRTNILAMLRPYAVPSSQSGSLTQRLKPGDSVNAGTLLARVKFKAPGRPDEQEAEIRSKVPGTVERWLVEDGSSITMAQEIMLISPSADMVWEALRALYLIGQPEDLPEVERYARGVDGMPARISTQAALTAQKIRERSKTP